MDNILLTLIKDYSILLLDAPTPAQRESVADEIANDPALAAAVIMLLSEQIFPIYPEPQEGIVQ